MDMNRSGGRTPGETLQEALGAVPLQDDALLRDSGPERRRQLTPPLLCLRPPALPPVADLLEVTVSPPAQAVLPNEELDDSIILGQFA
jgi:hypothetical protein